MFMTGSRCYRCGTVQFKAFEGYVCPACSGNLEIIYDYASAAEALADGFDGAASGVLRYRKLLPFDGSGLDFSLKIGGTPLYRAERMAQTVGLNALYLKDDSANPSASLKDRAGVVALQMAKERGARTVATASTGNAGSSMACLAAAMGLDPVVFVPAGAPEAKLVQLSSYGASVLAVRGSYDDAYDLCLAACEEFGWYNRSTGHNPFTREGKKTVAYEIWEDLDGEVPDRIVVPTGDGNIISGVWKGWRELQRVGLIDRLPKIDCAQSRASDAVCRTVSRLQRSAVTVTNWSEVSVDEVQATTMADSISVDRPRDGLAAVRAVIESGGEAVTVSDDEALAAVFEMAGMTGVFPEPAAAVPWAAVKHMAGQGRLAAGERVVCLVTGSGLKDTDGIAKFAGRPVRIEPTLEAVMKAMARSV